MKQRFFMVTLRDVYIHKECSNCLQFVILKAEENYKSNVFQHATQTEMDSKRKRHELSLKDKINLIRESDGQSQRQLVEKYGIGKTQVRVLFLLLFL